MSATPGDILTVEQAAEILRVRPKTVRALAGEGIIPAFKLGKFWRFNESQLREWALAKARENIGPPLEIGPRRTVDVRTTRPSAKSLGATLDAMLAEPGPFEMPRRRPRHAKEATP